MPNKLLMGYSKNTTRTAAFHAPDGPRRLVAPAPRLPERVVVPMAAAVAAGLLAREPFEAIVLTLLAFACAAFVVPERQAWAALLPLMRAPLVILSSTVRHRRADRRE